MKFVIVTQPNGSMNIEYLYKDGVLSIPNSGDWAAKMHGKVAGKIVDTGDGITVRLRKRKPISLDYVAAQELYCILFAHHQENQGIFGRIGLADPCTKSRKS